MLSMFKGDISFLPRGVTKSQLMVVRYKRKSLHQIVINYTRSIKVAQNFFLKVE